MTEQSIVADLIARWVSLGQDYSRQVPSVTAFYAYGASEEGEMYANIYFEQDGVVEFPGRLRDDPSSPERIERLQSLMTSDMREAEVAFTSERIPLPVEYRIYHDVSSGRTEAQLLRESTFAYPSERDMLDGIKDWIGDRAPDLYRPRRSARE